MTEQFVNVFPCAVAGTVGISDTSVLVTNGGLFPAIGTFRILLESELLAVTSRSSNTLTVLRGQEGTSAAAHSVGVPVIPVLTAAALAQLKTDVSFVAGGDVSGTATSQQIVHLTGGASGAVNAAPTTQAIVSSTSGSPIAVTVTAHGYSTGQMVDVQGHTVNTAANGVWPVTVTGANTFTLNGSTGNGVGAATGTVAAAAAVSFGTNAPTSNGLLRFDTPGMAIAFRDINGGHANPWINGISSFNTSGNTALVYGDTQTSNGSYLVGGDNVAITTGINLPGCTLTGYYFLIRFADGLHAHACGRWDGTTNPTTTPKGIEISDTLASGVALHILPAWNGRTALMFGETVTESLIKQNVAPGGAGTTGANMRLRAQDGATFGGELQFEGGSAGALSNGGVIRLRPSATDLGYFAFTGASSGAFVSSVVNLNDMALQLSTQSVVVHQASGTGVDLTANSVVSLNVSTGGVAAALPIIGYAAGNSPYSVHGGVIFAFASDGNYAVTAAQYALDEQQYNKGSWASGHTVTYPAPASRALAYCKTIFNNTTFTMTVSTGAGTTRTLATGLRQRFRFDDTGVTFETPTVTP